MIKPRWVAGAFLISISSLMDWVELVRQPYFFLIVRVRWFWGLTGIVSFGISQKLKEKLTASAFPGTNQESGLWMSDLA